MKTLYSSNTIRTEKQRIRTGLLLAAVLGCTALVVCIALCFGIRTANAAPRQITVIAVSTLGGWSIILLTEGLILPEVRELRHEEGILYGIPDTAAAGRLVLEDPVVCEGEILSIGEVFRIPKSISFFPVVLRQEGENLQLKLNARHRKGFPSEGTRVRMITVRNYITEYEEPEHV